MKKQDELQKVIYNYPTKHKEGFVTEEMFLLCKELGADVKLFNQNLGVNTVIKVKEEFVVYHTDVFRAMRETMGHEVSPLEWD